METKKSSISGLFPILTQIGIIVLVISYFNIYSNEIDSFSTWILPIFLIITFFKLFGGYVILNPNEAAVISFMGIYKGTLKENGFVFINPFYRITKWSLKVSNHKTEVLKVNEKDGVPIEISATITWKISDTYKAQYDVEKVSDYINNQFEISLRRFAQNHVYKELSGEGLEFIEDLKEKVSKAGVEILEAKITHLNYAAEIAGSMLQKQQASSLSDAKEIIVTTAVHIAKKAAEEIGDLTKDQKAKFISDLIVVLCSEKSVSPVLSV